MIETDEATDLEALQARKIADALHALRAFEESWAAYQRAKELHAKELKEHEARRAAFEEQKRRHAAFLERMEARKKLAAELAKKHLKVDSDFEENLVEFLRQHVEPEVEVHSALRQTKVLPGTRSAAIAFEAKQVPPGGLGRGLRDHLLRLVPRANRFLYTYQISYTRSFRAQNEVSLVGELTLFFGLAANAALAAKVPREEAPLFPHDWLPLPPELFGALLRRLFAPHGPEQGALESNDAAESKDSLCANESLRTHLLHVLARELLRLANDELLPRMVDRIPVVPRDEVGEPLDPGPPPPEPEPPRLVPGTARFWEELPWEAHVSRLKLGDDRAPGHLLLGYEPLAAEPIFLARPLLHAHAHVVGATQTGKTSAALIPLVTQLIRGSDEPPPPGELAGPPPPLLIIDLKGDFALFHTARLEAKRRGQTFRYFTTHPEKDSHVFDVIGSLASLIPYRGDLGAFFAQAFDIFHGPGYGHGFYSKENREATVSGLDKEHEQTDGEPTLSGLAEAIKTTGSRKTGHDAREAQATFAPLARPEIRCRLEKGPDTDPAKVIHIPSAVENREVLYFWIPILRSTAGLDIARLALYSLMHAVGERYYTRGERRTYAVVDEFQEVASFNIGRLLTFSAGVGLSVVMANQSVQNLKVGNTDIRDHVITNANLRMFFSVASGDDIEELQKLSGEKTVMTLSRQRSRSRSRGTLTNTTETDTFSESKGKNWAEVFSRMWAETVGSGGNARGNTWQNSSTSGGSEAKSEGESTQRGRAHSKAEGKGTSESWDWGVMFGRTETVRPALDANDIIDASLVDRACLVISKRDAGKTRLNGRPQPMRCLYCMDEEEYRARRRTVWPALPPKPPQIEAGAGPGPQPDKPPAGPPSSETKPPREHPKRRERGLLLQKFFDEHAPPPLREE